MSTALEGSPHVSQHAGDAQLRSLLESIKDSAVFMLDPEGRVVSWNAGAERIKGYSEAEIVGQHFSRFYPAEEVVAGKPARALGIAAKEGRFEEEEWRVRKDGTLFWANVVMTAVKTPAGELQGYAKVTRDLTERRAEQERSRALIREQAARAAAEALAERLRDSEEQQRRANEKLAAVLDGVADGITMQDPTGRLVYANEVAARMIGYPSAAALLAATPAEIMGAFEVMGEHGEPLLPEQLPGRAVLSGTTTQERVIRFRRKATGEERWSTVRSNAVRDEAGQPLFSLNLLHDITQKRSQDEALRISQEWFATVLRGIGDAVITTDPSGVVTFMNPACEVLTGWTSEGAAGRPLAEVFVIINEDSRQTVESPVDRVIREGIVVGLANHTLLIRKDGSELCIDDSAAPIRDGQGRLAGVVLVFRDVTEDRREERHRAFLAQATVELNSSLDYQATLATVARAAVPGIADWCAVDIVEDGRVQRVAVAHVDPEKLRFVQEVERRYPSDPNAPSGVPNILRTGQAEMVADIPAALIEAGAKDAQHLELIRHLSLHSYIGVPLIARGQTIGVITLVMAESNRRYIDSDLVEAKLLADRAASAIDNARLFRESQKARADAELANGAKDEFLAILLRRRIERGPFAKLD